MKVALEAGMEFASRNPQGLGMMINLFQKFQSIDNDSIFTHTGLIYDANGVTFEARNKLDHYHIDDYKGQHVMIVRPKMLTPEVWTNAWEDLKQYDGKTYPYFRLVLHLLRMAKYVHWETPVCSELTAKYEVILLLRKMWWGINPDNLADFWNYSKFHDIIFDGEWS